jgi:hypothetical protein
VAETTEAQRRGLLLIEGVQRIIDELQNDLDLIEMMNFSHPAYIATCELPFYRVLTKENATYFLRKTSSPFTLQDLRPLTPLKETYRFTSLTVIGMTKTMCNREPPKV